MKLAVIGAPGLGDGLIQLITVINLLKMEHTVTYFHDLVSHLSPLLSGVDVRTSTLANAELLTSFDWLIVDKAYKGINELFDSPDLAKMALIFSLSKSRPDAKLTNHFAAHPSLDTHQSMLLDTFNCKCLRRSNRIGPITDQLAFIFKNELNVESSTKNIDLFVPEQWRARAHQSRVMLHPESSSPSKNWKASSYLKLASRLQELGFEPTFTMSPVEQEKWIEIIKGRFECFSHSNLLEVAKLYYESGSFIGNDSGNGHLASMLGLPTITIFNQYKRQHAWRPGWTNGKVVHPLLGRRIVGRSRWQSSVFLNDIIKAHSSLI